MNSLSIRPAFQRPAAKRGATRPRRAPAAGFLLICACGLCPSGRAQAPDAPAERILPVREYADRMTGGWLGQMVGVAWGAPTEFHYCARIMPADKLPVWGRGAARLDAAFDQDDLYVEMTFLRTLERCGLEVSSLEAGIDFANSRYRLWHANRAGRDNLRRGIAPPDSGHPAFNPHSDDIDFQIEADFAGLISPGMPGEAMRLGGLFGSLMNHGDGIYGGQFVAAMYAAAFFESDPIALVEAGLRAIPRESLYHRCVATVLEGFRAAPGDWERTWKLLQERFHDKPGMRRASCSRGALNIDAKLNGAYVAMGLLYGRGEIERTIAIAMRCGQDSDCNPSSAAGVLFTTLGAARVPERFRTGIDPKRRFSYTPFTFPALVATCERLARACVLRAGGRIEVRAGIECLVIPRRAAKPAPACSSARPASPAGVRYSEAQRARILLAPGK